LELRCAIKENLADTLAAKTVLDIDLHFGDGTVNILEKRNWATVINVEASSRKIYLQEVKAAMKDYRADLIGISAGFDSHVADWGGLLHTEDYEEIGQGVRSAADRNGGGCFAILEGGYNHEVLGENALALIQGMRNSVSR
jgi:acetoin utilization deacetylase AcuC-like enzyme